MKRAVPTSTIRRWLPALVLLLCAPVVGATVSEGYKAPPPPAGRHRRGPRRRRR